MYDVHHHISSSIFRVHVVNQGANARPHTKHYLADFVGQEVEEGQIEGVGHDDDNDSGAVRQDSQCVQCVLRVAFARVLRGATRGGG